MIAPVHPTRGFLQGERVPRIRGLSACAGSRVVCYKPTVDSRPGRAVECPRILHTFASEVDLRYCSLLPGSPTKGRLDSPRARAGDTARSCSLLVARSLGTWARAPGGSGVKRVHSGSRSYSSGPPVRHPRTAVRKTASRARARPRQGPAAPGPAPPPRAYASGSLGITSRNP